MSGNPITKILLLAANPKDTDQLRLDEEFREIKEGLRLGSNRDDFEIRQGGAIRAKDLLRLLLEFKPNIIHFSGHASSDGIYLEDESGHSHLVNATALTSLFQLLEHVECVVLNACYSESQATLIARYIPHVIGMKIAIGDKAAINFATGFYDALVSGKTISQAYQFGCVAIKLSGIDEANTPVLLNKDQHIQSSKEPTKESTATKATNTIRSLKRPNPKREYDIFISYRTTHRDWVECLAKNLKQQGYKIFLDAWELRGGQNFTQTIYDAIKSSRSALLIATPDAAESGWVQREYEIMFKQQQEREHFFYIPVIFGKFPDFPFLETVHAVDFKDSNEAIYNEAFQRLICALEDKAPGASPHFDGELQYPIRYQDEQRSLVQQEQSFIEDTFGYLDTGTPVMILGQADTGTQHYAKALREKAEARYGENHSLHIYPPNSANASTADYFSRLAKQCKFSGDITASWQWADALAEQLEQGEEIFLLVSGFENGEETARAELAGELRGLAERFPHELKLVIIGSEKLAALKYQYGSMSLLNQIEEQRLPELMQTDLEEIFGQRYPEINTRQLAELLTFTGQNPRLVHACLQAGKDSAGECESYLTGTPLPSQLFTRFQQGDDKERLCTYLQQTEIGAYSAWPQDKLIRKLYWNNLIKQSEDKFIWRCEYIQRIGKQNMGC